MFSQLNRTVEIMHRAVKESKNEEAVHVVRTGSQTSTNAVCDRCARAYKMHFFPSCTCTFVAF